MNHEVYRDGAVHVLAERCSTCIFRPGNLMDLKGGVVKVMVDEALGVGGQIPCHSTIWRQDVKPAICRGFWDGYRDQVELLYLAAELGYVVEDPTP